MPAGPYEMDHGNGSNPGTFFPLLLVYHALFCVVTALSVFGAIEGWKLGEGAAAVVLLLAAYHALLFNGFLIFFYEAYMQGRYLGNHRQPDGRFAGKPGPSNYTLNRYATVLALAFSAVALLLCGVARIVMVVAHGRS